MKSYASCIVVKLLRRNPIGTSFSFLLSFQMPLSWNQSYKRCLTCLAGEYKRNWWSYSYRSLAWAKNSGWLCSGQVLFFYVFQQAEMFNPCFYNLRWSLTCSPGKFSSWWKWSKINMLTTESELLNRCCPSAMFCYNIHSYRTCLPYIQHLTFFQFI